MDTLYTINNNTTSVKIDAGELVSFIVNKEELMHQKGQPGWRNTDTEMFPIIGPTQQVNFSVSTPKGFCIQDQHGLLREFPYQLINSSTTTAVYQKKYEANTFIKNSKYPQKSTEPNVFWPYSFMFKKLFELNDNLLNITFEIESEKGMPFMLGYHPAFMLQGNFDEIILSNSQKITIETIMKGGDIAYPIKNSNTITLLKKSGYNLKIDTEGFNHFMLWTPTNNMLCIEPITAYPYTEGAILNKDLFITSKGKHSFKITVQPFN